MTDYSGLIKEFEGLRLNAYPDPLHGSAVATIGYGTTYYSDGDKVQIGDHITKEIAERELNNYIDKKVIPTLGRKIPTWGEMNDYQKEAIISFAYNLGSGFYGSKGFKTITKALSSTSNWKDVPKALELYRNPGSSVEQGLLRRRRAEGKLWNKKQPKIIQKEEIFLYPIIKYYKGLAHQKEALLWLTNKYPYSERVRLARIWNSSSKTVYSFDTYIKYYSGKPSQKEVINDIQANSPRYAEDFYRIWRQEDGLIDHIVKHMVMNGYDIAKGKGEVNIVYIESKDFEPEKFNDKRLIFSHESGRPQIIKEWDACTTPGHYYTKNPLNKDGAAMVKPGQYYAWQVGHHKSSNHPALVQTGGEVTVYRDSCPRSRTRPTA